MVHITLGLKRKQVMVPTYSEYIQRYVRRRAPGMPPTPGEHHFVAAYLVPRMYEITGSLPDYINPDGTKAILGDVVYYKDGQHHFGMEVKLGTVRLTKREMNEWIVSEDESLWPCVFVGVGSTGVAVSDWRGFRSAYLQSVRQKAPGWNPVRIDAGYGPQKSVDELVPYFAREAWFPLSVGLAATQYEADLVAAMRSHIEA